MREQRPLFGRRLWPVLQHPVGRNQRTILEALRSGGSMTAREAGELIHAERGRHPVGQPCATCDDDGRAVLISLRKRGLVVRRQVTARWEAVGQSPDGQELGELPEGF